MKPCHHLTHVSLRADVSPNSARPGTVAVVLARCSVRGGRHLLHLHTAAAVGGGAGRVGLHCRPVRPAWILYVSSTQLRSI